MKDVAVSSARRDVICSKVHSTSVFTLWNAIIVACLNLKGRHHWLLQFCAGSVIPSVPAA